MTDPAYTNLQEDFLDNLISACSLNPEAKLETIVSIIWNEIEAQFSGVYEECAESAGKILQVYDSIMQELGLYSLNISAGEYLEYLRQVPEPELGK